MLHRDPAGVCRHVRRGRSLQNQDCAYHALDDSSAPPPATLWSKSVCITARYRCSPLYASSTATLHVQGVARELARTLRAVRAQGEASVHVHGYRGLYLYRRGDEHHWLWRSCSLYCVWITPRQPLQQTGAVVTPRGAPHNDHLHGTRQGNAGNPRNSQQQRPYESQPCVQRCE